MIRDTILPIAWLIVAMFIPCAGIALQVVGR